MAEKIFAFCVYAQQSGSSSELLSDREIVALVRQRAGQTDAEVVIFRDGGWEAPSLPSPLVSDITSEMYQVRDGIRPVLQQQGYDENAQVNMLFDFPCFVTETGLIIFLIDAATATKTPAIERLLSDNPEAQRAIRALINTVTDADVLKVAMEYPVVRQADFAEKLRINMISVALLYRLPQQHKQAMYQRIGLLETVLKTFGSAQLDELGQIVASDTTSTAKPAAARPQTRGSVSKLAGTKFAPLADTPPADEVAKKPGRLPKLRYSKGRLITFLILLAIPLGILAPTIVATYNWVNKDNNDSAEVDEPWNADTDGDGVYNSQDWCKLSAGAKEWKGCPALESLTLQHGDYVRGAYWNADETRILSWSDDGTVGVWDAQTGAALLTLNHGGGVLSATWNRDETRILSSSGYVWDAETGETLLTVAGHNAVWSHDETRILTSRVEKMVSVWDAQTGEEIFQLDQGASIKYAAWNADDTLIFAYTESYEIGMDNMVKLWDAQTGEELFTLVGDLDLSGVAWNHAGTRLLAWENKDSSGVVQVWDAATGKEVFSQPYPNILRGGIWNRDDTQILTWGRGGAQIWDAQKGKSVHWLEPRDERGQIGFVDGATWNADETQILTWVNTSGMPVDLWDAQSGKKLHSFSMWKGTRGACLNPAETHLLAWSWDDTIRVWDVQTDEVLFAMSNNDFQGDNELPGVIWNADGTRILSWSLTTGTVKVWILPE